MLTPLEEINNGQVSLFVKKLLHTGPPGSICSYARAPAINFLHPISGRTIPLYVFLTSYIMFLQEYLKIKQDRAKIQSFLNKILMLVAPSPNFLFEKSQSSFSKMLFICSSHKASK